MNWKLLPMTLYNICFGDFVYWSVQDCYRSIFYSILEHMLCYGLWPSKLLLKTNLKCHISRVIFLDELIYNPLFYIGIYVSRTCGDLYSCYLYFVTHLWSFVWKLGFFSQMVLWFREREKVHYQCINWCWRINSNHKR